MTSYLLNIIEQNWPAVTVSEFQIFKDAIFIFFIAFINGAIVHSVYKKTYEGVLFSRGFCTSILLLPVVVALIIVTISNDLALSLGMIGALSIVRYRTPVKEPLDLFFIFWALSTGIASGAGYSLISLFFSSMIGAFLLIKKILTSRLDTKSINDYLLIVSFKDHNSDQLQCDTFLNTLSSFSEQLTLKSKLFEPGFCELIVAVKLQPGREQAMLKTIETEWNGQPKLLFPANDTISE